jgi:hypothetical protein
MRYELSGQRCHVSPTLACVTVTSGVQDLMATHVFEGMIELIAMEVV